MREVNHLPRAFGSGERVKTRKQASANWWKLLASRQRNTGKENLGAREGASFSPQVSAGEGKGAREGGDQGAEYVAKRPSLGTSKARLWRLQAPIWFAGFKTSGKAVWRQRLYTHASVQGPGTLSAQLRKTGSIKVHFENWVVWFFVVVVVFLFRLSKRGSWYTGGSQKMWLERWGTVWSVGT